MQIVLKKETTTGGEDSEGRPVYVEYILHLTIDVWSEKDKKYYKQVEDFFLKLSNEMERDNTEKRNR